MLRAARRWMMAFILMVAPMAVGSTFAGCTFEQFLMAINPCGTVLSNCTADTWYETVVWPYVKAPDFERDPSCTIPYGCGTWFGGAGTIFQTGPTTGTTTTTTTTGTATTG